MSTETTAPPGSASFDPQALLSFLDGPYHELRAQVREELSKPEYAKPVELPRPEYRELVLQWLRRVAATEATGQGFPVEYGGGGDPGANVAAFETTAHHDLSLLVKIGVHYGLWGGAVLNLGTKVHHDKYIPDTLSIELPGCFAMTETGHGSDVQALRTTATYDAETQEFVVDTVGSPGTELEFAL